MITIRRAIEEDAEQYQTLTYEGLQESPTAFGASINEFKQRSLESIRERLAKRVMYFAWDGKKLVGTVGIDIRDMEKFNHTANVYGVYVTPAYRGQGVGKLLMQTIIDHARTMDGVIQLAITVTTSNIPALRLYERLGFVTFGQEPRALFYDEQYYDETHMMLALD